MNIIFSFTEIDFTDLDEFTVVLLVCLEEDVVKEVFVLLKDEGFYGLLEGLVFEF